MGFLNKKEDVIDFQLTQYGKYLVSQGRFKPVYYAFFDDDVLYDRRHVPGSDLEIQKDIETRILEETPSLAAQYLFHSVDNLGMQNQFSRSDKEAERAKWDWYQTHRNKLQQTPEKHYALTRPLADSSLLDDKAPAFQITFKEGEIESVETILSGSDDESFSMQTIPQINLKNVRFSIVAAEGTPPSPPRADEMVTVFPDGTFFHVLKKHISFTITEENTLLDKDNFDLEVYVLDNKNKIEYPLYFKKSPEMVQDGILIDTPPDRLTSPGGLEVDDVEYFFDIFLDDDAFLIES
ncbi:hypothetical protein CMI37_16895 [Candidatus Pacearchaeota archaeon]|nr:hypothetical protein [Candidatus Pacearchaeota archaeon]